MNVRSETEPCSELRDEIRQLEAELNAIDRQLGEVSARVELGAISEAFKGSTTELAHENGPSSVESAASPLPGAAEIPSELEPTEERSEEDKALSVELRSGVGQAIAPYKRIEFSDDDPEGRFAERRDSRLLRWLGMAVVTLGIVGIWMMVVRPVLSIEDAQVQTERMEAFAAVLDEDLDRAETSLREFFGATSVQDVLRCVRQADTLEPLIRGYYREHTLVPYEIEVDAMERVHHFDRPFVIAVVKHAGTPPDGRQVAVELSEDGAKVDWELATNSQKTAWEALPKSQEQGFARPFRIEMQSADYYNHEFDEANWVCFRVSAPEVDKPVYAYAPRESQLAQRLRSVLAFEQPNPAQVVASFAPGDRVDVVRQLKILELVSDQWLVPTESLPLFRPQVEGGLISFN